MHEAKIVTDNLQSLQFAIFYHDIIYNVLKRNNEFNSAELARIRLTALNVPQLIKANCIKYILATKNHIASEDNDTNLMIDLDLCILGSLEKEYNEYVKNIRKEYSLIPDNIFYNQRRKWIMLLLQREKIYTTHFFYHKFEARARKNLTNEINTIKS